MTQSERAAQIWPVLALAARNRQVLTYGILGRLIGLIPQELGHYLEPIQSYCLLHRLPPLSILVVSKNTGMPGGGLVAAQDIPKTQQEVFLFDWLARGGPQPDHLEAAVKERPSNGIIVSAA